MGPTCQCVTLSFSLYPISFPNLLSLFSLPSPPSLTKRHRVQWWAGVEATVGDRGEAEDGGRGSCEQRRESRGQRRVGTEPTGDDGGEPEPTMVTTWLSSAFNAGPPSELRPCRRQPERAPPPGPAARARARESKETRVGFGWGRGLTGCPREVFYFLCTPHCHIGITCANSSRNRSEQYL